MAEGWVRIQLEVVTPERRVLSTEVDELTAPGALGYFGVLPGHTPFLTTLGLGELGYRIGNEWEYLAITWGYAEVLPNQVTILTQTAEMAEEIDIERGGLPGQEFDVPPLRPVSAARQEDPVATRRQLAQRIGAGSIGARVRV